MDSDSVVDKLLDKTGEISHDIIREYGDRILSEVKSNQLQVIDLVKRLNPALTNSDNNIRLRGVQILSQVITSLPHETLSSKELEVLQEFLNQRLIDHKTMEQPVLRCLSYFADCQQKPDRYDKNLLEFLKTKVNVHQMDNKSRLLIYEISKKIVLQRRQRTKTIDSDLLYSVIHMIEGENNPQNLMLCFSLVSYVMKNFEELNPYIDDLFEWLASYYPIDYTPKDSEGGAIRRADLVEALEDCFFANPLNSDNLQTLLLEKLDSSSMLFKVEALKSLTKCYEIFSLASIKDYSSSLWTSIRMNCLKKLDTVNSELLSASYEALSALTSKLSQDRELYMRFVIDLYEELAIAFRKPEMDLFEPAARLIAHAVLPRLDGFDYILDKILPTSLNAINAKELRPIAGLVYMFELMFRHHRNIDLKADVTKSLCNIVSALNDFACNDADSLRLINSLVRNGVKFDEETLSKLEEKLLSNLDDSRLDIEESLALIRINYNQPESIESLLKSIGSIESQNVEFTIYLRRVVMILDKAQGVEIESISSELGAFLSATRDLITSSKTNARCLENVGRLHAIVLNKLSEEATNSLVMELFQSEFCQKLIPPSMEQATRSTQLYMPVIGWVLKSLVMRNHQLVMPLVNLLLNFLSSDQIDRRIALAACSGAFTLIFKDNHSSLFDKENHYRFFALYKQKFYTQASKEIKVRIEANLDPIKKHAMVCLLALQIPYLPRGVYRKDSDWMTRELLKILQSSRDQLKNSRESIQEELASIIFECMSSFISNHASEGVQSHLSTIIDLSLTYACEAHSLEIRRKALSCLTDVAGGLNEKQLLPFRSSVVDRLRVCLSDKKRLVRQKAAAARLRWVLVGQPVGN